MLKNFVHSIAFVLSVLPFYEEAESRQLHALPNYYNNHGTSAGNYRNSIFSRPISSCKFFAPQPRFNGKNFEWASGASPLLSLSQYQDLYEEVTFSPMFEFLCGWAKYRLRRLVKITETRTLPERFAPKTEFIDMLGEKAATIKDKDPTASNILESYIPLIEQIFPEGSLIDTEDLERQAQELNGLGGLLAKYNPKDLTIHEAKDPTLSYLFDYGVSNVDTFTESTFKAINEQKDGILYHLTNKTLRKNLMIQCRWSPADLITLIEHDIFVALNHCAHHLADTLRKILCDIFDDPTTYTEVPFSSEKEKKEQENMRKASYLLTEGTFALRGNPYISVIGDANSQTKTRGKAAIPFRTNNKLTRSLAKFTNENAEINKSFVAEVAYETDFVDLFVKLEDMRRHKNNEVISYEKLKNWDSARLKTIKRILVDYPTIAAIAKFEEKNGTVLDCNGIQTRNSKSLSGTCAMNSCTQIFLQNNIFPGLFIYEDLKDNKLSQFFANLSKNSGSSPENERRFKTFSLQQGGFYNNDAWASTASLFGSNFVSLNSLLQVRKHRFPPVYFNIYGPLIFLDEITNHARWFRMASTQDTARQGVDKRWQVYTTDPAYDKQMHKQGTIATEGKPVHTFINSPNFTGRVTYFDYLHNNKPSARPRTAVVKTSK